MEKIEQEQTAQENEVVQKALSHCFLNCVENPTKDNRPKNRPVNPVELFGDMFRTE